MDDCVWCDAFVDALRLGYTDPEAVEMANKAQVASKL